MSDEKTPADDAAALAGDWQRVGDDLRKAAKQAASERLIPGADEIPAGHIMPFVVNLAGEKSVLVRKHDPRGELLAAVRNIAQRIKDAPETVDRAELRALVVDVMATAPVKRQRSRLPRNQRKRKRRA